MKSRTIIFILGLILISFFISANLAWLNPRPNFEPLAKWSEEIPLFWQYNLDVETFLNTATDFPKSYLVIKTMIQRPAYIMLASWGSGLLRWMLPWDIETVHANMVTYLIINVLLYVLYGVLFLKLISRYTSDFVAKWALAFTYFHHFSFISLGIYHTNLFQFVTPVVAAFLFQDLAKSYSTRKNLLYSFWLGVLMLAKENYAIYLACLGVALWKKRYKEAILSFVVHLIPLFLWLDVLRVYGIPYYHHGFEQAGAVSWLMQDFVGQSILQMIRTVGESWLHTLVQFANFYSVFAVLAVVALTHLAAHKEIKKEIAVFAGLLVATTWLQIFVSHRYESYMVADIAFLVFTLGAWFMSQQMNEWSSVKKKKVAVALASLWLFGNVVGTMHFPWAHPYEQHAYDVSVVTETEAYLAQFPETILSFSQTFDLSRWINPWGRDDEWVIRYYISSGEIHHTLEDAYQGEEEGCSTYRFTSPYHMIQGKLVNETPEEIAQTYFGVEGQWFLIPTQQELTLDFTMHKKGLHEMTIDPEKLALYTDLGGYSRVIYVDEQKVVGDNMPAYYPYDFVLYEDGVPLPYPHTTDLQEIIEKGEGRYTVREDGLIVFSATDNTDPRENGHVYQVKYTVYSSFAEPYNRTEYGLKFCPKVGDFAFEEAIKVTTQVQFPKAIVPLLREMSKSSPQVSST